MNFEFSGETKEINGITLHRIRATKDINGGGVKAGDLGGWIEKESNLNGSAWVYGNALVFGKARVGGSAHVYGNSRVYGNAEVSDTAVVQGDTLVYGNALVCGNARVFDNARVYGSAVVIGDALICGDAQVYGNANVSGNARVYGNARICGSANVYGNADVSGNAIVRYLSDHSVFKNTWSSGRFFTYTRSNMMWKCGCFYGTGVELIEKAYRDSEISGKCYEAIVCAQEMIEKAVN